MLVPVPQKLPLHVSDCLAKAQRASHKHRRSLVIEIDSSKMKFVTFMLINCVCDNSLKLKRQQINAKFQLSKHKQNKCNASKYSRKCQKVKLQTKIPPAIRWPIFEPSCLSYVQQAISHNKSKTKIHTQTHSMALCRAKVKHFSSSIAPRRATVGYSLYFELG